MNKTPYKRKFITLGRIIKTGFINFVRNASLAVAATTVMVITLSIVLFSVIANASFTNTLQQLTDKIVISVYLKDDVNDQQREKLIADLKGIENVRSVEYITKDRALEEYREDNQDKPDLLVAISQTDNPLPAHLRVKSKDPNKIQDVRNFIEKPDVKVLQSDETSYSGERKEAIDNISRSTSFLRKAALAGVVVFALVSVMIIFNTIRMAIFNRRDELTIMRLLGANTSYIRGPFIVETILYGIVAAILSVTLCETLFRVQASAFDASSLGLLDIKYANQYFADRYWRILLIQLGIGTLIGAASSYIATHRYLKFKAPK